MDSVGFRLEKGNDLVQRAGRDLTAVEHHSTASDLCKVALRTLTLLGISFLTLGLTIVFEGHTGIDIKRGVIITVAFLIWIGAKQKDKEYFLKIVDQGEECWLLECAHEDLRRDKKFILEALQRNLVGMRLAHEDLTRDREFIWEAARQNSLALTYMHEELTKDRGFMLDSLKQGLFSLGCADEELINDRAFVLEAVEIEPYSVNVIPESWKRDEEFILEAIDRNIESLKHFHEGLLKDKQFMLKVIKQNSWCLFEELKKGEEYVERAIKHSYQIFSSIHHSLKSDEEFLLKAINLNWIAMKYVDEDLIDSEEFVLKALKQNPWMLLLADNSLLKNDGPYQSTLIDLRNNIGINLLEFLTFIEPHDKKLCKRLRQIPYSLILSSEQSKKISALDDLNFRFS